MPPSQSLMNTGVFFSEALKLKQHKVQETDGQRRVHELCGPFDLEGHKGTDDRHYLIDFQ